jgi:hypothetical protein
MDNITCLGDFCILDEACPFFSSCMELVYGTDEDEEDKD